MRNTSMSSKTLKRRAVAGVKRGRATPAGLPEAPDALSRRGMLGRLCAALGGLLGMSVLAGCPGGSTYRQRKSPPGGEAAGGKNVSRLEWDQKSLPDGISAQFFVDGKPAYLLYISVHGTANYTAVKRRCPHSGCTVNYSYQTRRLECPCHGSRFLADGTLEKGPARRNLTTYPVKMENGKVIVEIPGSVLAVQGVSGIFLP